MNEHPILFNAAMVRAILAGTKTQTRRVVKPQPDGFHHASGKPAIRKGAFAQEIECPYGQPGDRLWVRETWMLWGPPERQYVDYRATCPNPDNIGPWKPSIHMPRAASRITLEITDVRVQRVQDISHSDMRAEGVRPNQEASLLWRETLTENFLNLWNTINAKRGYGWESNPWVWAVSFQRVTQEGGAA